MLQCVEAEVGQPGHVLAGRPDSEDAAGILGTLLLGIQVVGEQTVAARHVLSVGARGGFRESLRHPPADLARAAPAHAPRLDGAPRRTCAGRPHVVAAGASMMDSRRFRSAHRRDGPLRESRVVGR